MCAANPDCHAANPDCQYDTQSSQHNSAAADVQHTMNRATFTTACSAKSDLDS